MQSRRAYNPNVADINAAINRPHRVDRKPARCRNAESTGAAKTVGRSPVVLRMFDSLRSHEVGLA
jgi:hypothetical protein